MVFRLGMSHKTISEFLGHMVKSSQTLPFINYRSQALNFLKSKALALSVIFLLGCLTAGCTTLSLTYNYADWYLLWKVNHYFDISMDQKTFLQPRLTNLHHWHRKHQIPEYVAFLKQVANDFQDGLTEHKLEKLVHSYEQLHNQLLERLVEGGAPFLASLQRPQVEYLQKTIKEENQELLEEVGRTPEEQLAWRIKETIEWMEDWVGSLTSSQHSAIVKHGTELALFKPSWADNHVHRKQQLITYLSANPTVELIAQEITNWFIIPPAKTLPGYEANIPKRKQNLIALLLKIEGILSDEQRTRGLQNLQDLIQDLEALATT